ncbi:MAG TPA: thiamine biosynthesis protein ThiC [Deltaproteobacteria bacterium]|nr:MAG: phosphomethylpyrimidine synthase [Deltaproteobacteria bacterium GWA2_55_82]OGQ62304.1 MAG: phosphomethylpyrimidine synthase [Deltaproteobacteria bacterium RIFCSPLOWO2_02_FULL_55_12]OIJ74416.1 MAG: phosphomethylpyrimidine synthase [Deltaproteobacteria bacterium GWC2_55_46]HBG47068.1 thiamine biosynthesis protein ThiC [Deltaproteobacteria bacterium]HCY10873.1 thiamine biosynthesis protein ThiC [Deltaproteobacteria bacterium]
MNQVESAKKGIITKEVEKVAASEGIGAEDLRQKIADGRCVIPLNSKRASALVGIGMGLRTKVNASIGTSSDIVDVDAEVRKAIAAERAGADTLMELSVGGDLDSIRKEVLSAVNLPVGSVPLYQAFKEAIKKYHDPNKLTEELLFDVIERQCADGISFMAVHCGINRLTIERLQKQGYRYGGLVSRGGSYMVGWMLRNGRENPLYEKFDRVVEIFKKYDCVLSLGNGLRAGAIHDSLDRAQVQELIINCELAEVGRSMGCQMMCEGPGHLPLDDIEANVKLQKRMSDNAPFYVLGPLTTDVAAGYDHISAAIGAAEAARYGADLICYVTPAEHLALPNEEDVVEGVRAARTAAHVGDMVKLGRKGRDLDMSKARRDLKWDDQFKLGLFGERAKEIRESRAPEAEETCTMCGSFCALDNAGGYFKAALEKGQKK